MLFLFKRYKKLSLPEKSSRFFNSSVSSLHILKRVYIAHRGGGRFSAGCLGAWIGKMDWEYAFLLLVDSRLQCEEGLRRVKGHHRSLPSSLVLTLGGEERTSQDLSSRTLLLLQLRYVLLLSGLAAWAPCLGWIFIHVAIADWCRHWTKLTQKMRYTCLLSRDRHFRYSFSVFTI